MRKWLFGPSLSARMARTFIQAVIGSVIGYGSLPANVGWWRGVLAGAIALALVPLMNALQAADE